MSDLLKLVESYNKIVFFIGHSDIKNGESAQHILSILKQFALNILEVGTGVAITILPPVCDVNKNCPLFMLNRQIEKLASDSEIQVIVIDHYKETLTYILDTDGNLSKMSVSKIANEMSIKVVEKKAPTSNPDKENQPPAPKMTLDECLP